MVSGLNVWGELQDLYVNRPMSYFIKGFFTDSFHHIVPVAVEAFLSCFSACYLAPVGSSPAFLGCALV